MEPSRSSATAAVDSTPEIKHPPSKAALSTACGPSPGVTNNQIKHSGQRHQQKRRGFRHLGDRQIGKRQALTVASTHDEKREGIKRSYESGRVHHALHGVPVD